MIGIIDYNMGNVASVVNAFEYIGESVSVIRKPEELKNVDKIVLPGVGAFRAGMENLKKQSLIDALNDEVLAKKKPFLGICLGMQLIARESSEFGLCAGLGWIDGCVRKFDAGLGLRVPHIGWNNLIIKKPSRLLRSSGNPQSVYFVHSYYVEMKDSEAIAASSFYGTEFAAMIEKDNIFATQFHPEKSQKSGLEMLDSFSEI